MNDASPLRLVSWNVHGWVGLDGIADLTRFRRVLSECRAQILGLQEVSNDYREGSSASQLLRLAQELELSAEGGPTILRPEGDYGNALLSTLPVKRVRHLDLSLPGREPRAALDADLDWNRCRLRVMVTHLGLRPFERRYQVKRLIEAIRQHPYDVLVLMGDLNEWLIFGRPARWMHRHFGQRGGPPTFPSRMPLFALDRIFVEPPFLLGEVRTLRTPLARLASDHLPVLGTLARPRYKG